MAKSVVNNHRASLGVALMARDSAETLPRCLASLRPFVQQIVVGVDVTTTDKTVKIARKYGADHTFPLIVSEPHECPRHGKVMAQHFARARQETWKRLDSTLDAWMWIDADDVLKGGERLKAVVEKMVESPAVGAWFKYHYATLNDGAQTNTLFDRERICRVKQADGTPIVWEWQHRVHEVIAPKNVSKPRWLLAEAGFPEVFHQEGRHSTHNSSTRNLLLLEIDLEENPHDHRAMFYIANQFFALGKWPEAIYWYELVGQKGENHYERWQSACYASLAYERLGNLDGATQAAYVAMDIEPRHPEPYLRLASIATLTGEHDKCLYWTEQARSKQEPPFFVFKNPLDYSYNARMPLADSLATLGRVSEARAELEEAYKVIANESVGKAIAHYKEMERDQQIANAFLTLNQGKDDETVIANFERAGLDDGVLQFGRVRDRVMPAYLRRRVSSQPRLVFWCGRSLEEWSPLSLTTTGIGGSETAVVEIAKRFARDGWRVDVYNGAGRFEGEYSGVGYWEPERLGPGEACDVFVSWRQPRMPLGQRIGKTNVLWCHDLNYGPDEPGHFRTWDKVLGVSAWHAMMLKKYYGVTADYVPNGIDLSRFTATVRKQPFQCVYASSPDRGLERLLALWPRILKREPGTTLNVAYGWNNIDKAIANGRGDLAALKARVVEQLDALKDSVTWHGRLGQNDLAQLYAESAVWTYPTDFLEVSCISAMEAMAAGAVPVATKVGALPETVGDAGLLVDGMPQSRVWSDFYTNILLGVLTEVNLRKPLEYRARQRAQALTWDAAYQRWKEVLGLVSSNGVATREMVAV